MEGKHKTWLTPFVTVTFAAIAITGILMLLHVKIPGSRAIHEWGGLIFFIAALGHLVLNWRTITGYFSGRAALVGSIAGVVMILVILVIAPNHQDHDSYDREHHSSSYSHQLN